uniref:rRNA adenine N(6)-methyltransferase n=1 Tax=Parascaris univalens TaxID=6257 RepID=A0A915B0K3_PARUN
MNREHLAEASDSRLHVHHADALKTDIGAIWQASATESTSWDDAPPRLHVVGNLPFHIASPLIIKYLREMHTRTSAWSYGRVPLTLTFQMEVARRICAPIDSDARARISIMSMFVSEPKILFEIPGSCFVPKPKINVGVVRFIPRIEPLIKCAFEVVEKICRHIFHYRQKYLIKCVRTLYPESLAESLSHELLSVCRVDPSTISIKLGVEQFADICYAYEEQCKRYPGLFLYDYTRPSRTLDELSRLPDASPPSYIFREDVPPAGISLSNSENVFR